MTKKELTALVAQQTVLTNASASQAVDTVFNALKEGLKNGESTTIQGFGTFGIKQRNERNGINPSTKQPMTIPARKMAKFTPSKKIEIK